MPVVLLLHVLPLPYRWNAADSTAVLIRACYGGCHCHRAFVVGRYLLVPGLDLRPGVAGSVIHDAATTLYAFTAPPVPTARCLVLPAGVPWCVGSTALPGQLPPLPSAAPALRGRLPRFTFWRRGLHCAVACLPRTVYAMDTRAKPVAAIHQCLAAFFSDTPSLDTDALPLRRHMLPAPFRFWFTVHPVAAFTVYVAHRCLADVDVVRANKLP